MKRILAKLISLTISLTILGASIYAYHLLIVETEIERITVTSTPEVKNELAIFTNCKEKKVEDLAVTISILFNEYPAAYDTFVEAGGEVYILKNFSQKVKTIFNKNVQAAASGAYFIDNNGIPIIVYNYDKYNQPEDIYSILNFDDTIVHEIAHFIDLYMLKSSETKEFLYLFNTYSKDYEPYSGVIDGYAASDIREMFAIVFNDIELAPDTWTESNIPEEVRDYMVDVIQKVKGSK